MFEARRLFKQKNPMPANRQTSYASILTSPTQNNNENNNKENKKTGLDPSPPQKNTVPTNDNIETNISTQHISATNLSDDHLHSLNDSQNSTIITPNLPSTSNPLSQILTYLAESHSTIPNSHSIDLTTITEYNNA